MKSFLVCPDQTWKICKSSLLKVPTQQLKNARHKTSHCANRTLPSPTSHKKQLVKSYDIKYLLDYVEISQWRLVKLHDVWRLFIQRKVDKAMTERESFIFFHLLVPLVLYWLSRDTGNVQRTSIKISLMKKNPAILLVDNWNSYIFYLSEKNALDFLDFIPCTPGIKKGFKCVLDSKMKNLTSLSLDKQIRQC